MFVKKSKRSVLLCSICLMAVFMVLKAQAAAGPAPADAEQAKKMANLVVDKLVAGDYSGIYANFNEQMKGTVSVEQLEAGWKAVKSQIGEYKSRMTPETQERDGHYGAYLVCQMERGRVGIEVWVDSAGKIAGLWLRPA